MGHGYDIHRLASREEAGQPVVISGVRFNGMKGQAPDFELGTVAHSDGDVVYHAVVDVRYAIVKISHGSARTGHLGRTHAA